MASIASNLASKLTQICPKWPQNDSQTTPTVLYSCGQYYCTLFGGIQVIFGWRKGRNQPKTLNLVNLHSMVFLTSNIHNSAKFSFENYKARQTFLDHFWKPKLPNKTQNFDLKGVTLCCHNCNLTEFTNMLPTNVRSSIWQFWAYLQARLVISSRLGVLTKKKIDVM